MREFTLIQGDCLKVMPSLSDASIDMILCDLPYGITACEWDTRIPLEPLWAEYKRLIKPNGVIVLTASQPFSSMLVMSNLKMFKYELIWNKQVGKAPGVAKYRPMPSHENILLFGHSNNTYNPQMKSGMPYKARRGTIRKSNEHKFGYNSGYCSENKGIRHPLSVIDVPVYSIKGQHPTQKPVALMEYLIRTYTNEGYLVLDNCMGSGTTGVAALRHNRRFIGIELNQGYLEMARKRICDDAPMFNREVKVEVLK